jgi:hypothetical protein
MHRCSPVLQAGAVFLPLVRCYRTLWLRVEVYSWSYNVRHGERGEGGRERERGNWITQSSMNGEDTNDRETTRQWHALTCRELPLIWEKDVDRWDVLVFLLTNFQSIQLSGALNKDPLLLGSESNKEMTKCLRFINNLLVFAICSECTDIPSNKFQHLNRRELFRRQFEHRLSN